jgi:hypothetical protein
MNFFQRAYVPSYVSAGATLNQLSTFCFATLYLPLAALEASVACFLIPFSLHRLSEEPSRESAQQSNQPSMSLFHAIFVLRTGR